MNRTAKVLLCVVVVLGVSVGVEAATPEIVVGTHYLNANQAGQIIEIYVTGGDEVQGLEFYARIGGGTSGPIFEDVDVLGIGSLFDGNNTGLNPGSYINTWDAYIGTTTSGGYVSADGLLATLMLDTTGLFSGEFDLSLADTLEGRTNFAGVYVNIADGSIIIPEPTSLMLILTGSGLLIRRRRNKI